jgi:hypothetical protein
MWVLLIYWLRVHTQNLNEGNMAAEKKGKIINWAMVGCGGMVGAHWNGYQELLNKGETRLRIVAAVDEALGRAKGFAECLEGFSGQKVNADKNPAQLLNRSLSNRGSRPECAIDLRRAVK